MATTDRSATHESRKRSIISIASPVDPAAREARAAQSTNDVRILLHQFPDERRSMVLDHGDDGALVDAEVVVVEPAFAVNGPATAQSHRRILQRRVEGIKK